MGLDIAYYRRLTKVDCVFDSDGEPIDPTTRLPIGGDWMRADINRDFPGRADELDDGAIYRSDDSRRFRAGSYSGYSLWREALSKLAGYPQAEYTRFGTKQMRYDAGAWASDSGPFWELIMFSDCAGVIGAKVSAKLASDFAQFQSAADAHGDEHFRDMYTKWREAFTVASDGGAVDFG